MKRKKIIPLVSIVILIVLIVVGGTTLFIFKTRDKENNVSKKEKTQIIEKTNETLSEDEIINSEDELPMIMMLQLMRIKLKNLKIIILLMKPKVIMILIVNKKLVIKQMILIIKLMIKVQL